MLSLETDVIGSIQGAFPLELRQDLLWDSREPAKGSWSASWAHYS